MSIGEELLRQNLSASILVKQKMIQNDEMMRRFGEAATLVVDAYKNGGRIYIAGNGGSAADAQHLAAEFVSKLAKDRRPLPAEALTVDSSILTAIGNDYGFEEIFARQVIGKMQKGDVFLGITTSGRSSNIKRALEACRIIGVKSIVFTGKDGGFINDIADYVIVAEGETTAQIQEIHIVFAHTLCGLVENVIFGE